MTSDGDNEVVRIEELCPAGGTHEVTYIDAFDGSTHQVHRAVTCGRCGSMSESDYGELPPDVRNVVLVTHGSWEVFVKTSDRLRIISAIRDLLKLPLDEARAKVRLDEPLFSGSRAEAKHFATQLIERGVESKAISVRIKSGDV